ncbi:hypothetical protein BH09ACT10_BH09ACT10_15040 [soil metagenome]
MKINQTFSYEGADVSSVFGLITNKEFRDEVSEKIHAISYESTIEPHGEGFNVSIKRKMPAQMPDFIKKLTGETVEVLQREDWSAPAADGSRTADVKVNILGQPASMTGTAKIYASGSGTEFSLTGDVTVKIPFLGKKIEPEVAKAIIAALTSEVELGKAKFAAEG